MVLHSKIGNVLVQEDKLEDAMKARHEGLAITNRLLVIDGTNTQWQNDLVIWHRQIGDLRVLQGKFADALEAYRNALATTERLVKAEPGNASWQRSMSNSYGKIGEALTAQGKLAEALAAYRQRVAIAQRLAGSDGGNAQDGLLGSAAEDIGSLAYHLVLSARSSRKRSKPPTRPSRSHPRKCGSTRIARMRSCSLAASRRQEASMERYRGQNARPETPWTAVILKDFAELRQIGLSHPLMEEIEAEICRRRQTDRRWIDAIAA